MSVKERLENLPNLYKKNGSINGNIFRNKNQDILLDLTNETSWCRLDEPTHMRVYCVLNDIHGYPKCQCGNNLNYSDSKVGFRQYCSRSCTVKINDGLTHLKGRVFSEESKQKQKNTNIERYGVDCIFKSKQFIESNQTKELIELRNNNRSDSVKRKYGVDNVFQLERVVDKIKNTSVERYGVTNHTQKHWNDDTLKMLNDKSFLCELAQKHTSNYIAMLIGCDSATVLKYLKLHGIEYRRKSSSSEEQMLIDYLTTLGVEFEVSKCGLLEGKREIDIYIPSKNLAIEVNGLYWHSDKVRPDKNYHQKKYDELKNKGISLIQFWDYEIRDRFDLCVSVIRHKLGLSSRKIYARKCSVIKLNADVVSSFISSNHIQPLSRNNIHYSIGLMCGTVLVSVMTFSRIGSVYTLQRFCSLIGVGVVGGFSKLLKHFLYNQTHNTLITYSDARYSDGDVYLKNGFVVDNVTKESTYYYTKDFKFLENRWNFTRDKIKKKYPEQFDENKTEFENMKSIGYHVVYGCKITRWKYTKNPLN